MKQGPLLVLTMPGFGTETLRHLLQLTGWPQEKLIVGLIGEQPTAWRYLAAKCRFLVKKPAHRYAHLVSPTLSARPAEQWLTTHGISWQWLRNDKEVCSYRARLKPALTLTLTSRIIFSANTLQTPVGDWFNIHPGLLPDYAGAVPAPYMFMDGVGGCSIHVMSEQIDAGALVDFAPMQGPLGKDGGEYFFEHLPAHTAQRIAAFTHCWFQGSLEMHPIEQSKLRFCSSAKLMADRQLDWNWRPSQLLRWVSALEPIAPAWFLDCHGRRVEIAAVRASTIVQPVQPGTILQRNGRWIDVSCLGGAVALLCRCRPRDPIGSALPLKAACSS